MDKLIIGFVTLMSFSAGAEQINGQDIIGNDGRHQVSKSEMSPIYSSIGLLDFRFGNKFYTCTGTLVGPRHVITAAHCIWDEGKLADEVIFYPGSIETDDVLELRNGSYTSKEFRVFEKYYTNPSCIHDVGMIIFADNIPGTPLQLSVADSSRVLGRQEVSVAGYPNDKLYGTMWESSEKNAVDKNFDFDSHFLDTTHGMSGASLRLGSTVIGIHSRGMENSEHVSVRNPSHFFSKKSLSKVQAWIKESSI